MSNNQKKLQRVPVSLLTFEYGMAWPLRVDYSSVEHPREPHCIIALHSGFEALINVGQSTGTNLRYRRILGPRLYPLFGSCPSRGTRARQAHRAATVTSHEKYTAHARNNRPRRVTFTLAASASRIWRIISPLLGAGMLLK